MSHPLWNKPISHHAVKALIYREDGSMLLQQRDDNPNLAFPNTWIWFGGLVEPGEDLKDALERELIEELGCMPGRIEEELFQWMWTGEEPAVNHIFSVCFLVNEIDLVLMEGKAMKWYSLQEICELNLTPLVYNNISKISSFLKARSLIDKVR